MAFTELQRKSRHANILTWDPGYKKNQLNQLPTGAAVQFPDGSARTSSSPSRNPTIATGGLPIRVQMNRPAQQ